MLLRLAFVFVAFPYIEHRWNLREDGDGYRVIAQTIRDGRYDDVTRGPIYPAFVAIAGSPLAVKVLQAFWDVATCLLVYWLANRSLSAAWLWAVYPFAIWRVAFINKEIALVFLLASYICVQVMALREGKAHQWLGAGALLGLVNFCKPTFLPWPLVVATFARWNRLPLARVALLIWAMIALIAPWTVRNWRVTGGEFVPVATEVGGMTTFVGNYQPTDGLWEGAGKIRWQSEVDEIKRQHRGASVVELDRVFYRAAWQQMTSNPLKALEIVVRKCGRFWFLSAAQRERPASCAIQIAYLLLAGIGLWRRRPWSQRTMLLVTLILYVWLIHAISYADLRFSLPVMPFVCVFSAAAFQPSEHSTDATRSATVRTS